MHIWRSLLCAFLWRPDLFKVVAWKLPGETILSVPAGTHRRRRTGPAADPTTCVPNGLSVFYDNVYEVPEPNGELYGYDASDVRYRQPVNSDHIPGGNATLVYTHVINGVTGWVSRLWIGGTHIANHDEEYKRCIGVGAVVRLDAPLLYQQDKYPYWDPYPIYDQRPDDAADENGTFPQIFMPDREWSTFYSQIETFIDEYLFQGTNVWMYDPHGDYAEPFEIEQEACGAAVQVAATYLARKENIDASAAIDRIASLRPDKTCFNETLGSPEVFEVIEEVVNTGRRLRSSEDRLEAARLEAEDKEEDERLSVEQRLLLEAEVAKLEGIRAEIEARRQRTSVVSEL